MLQFQETGKPVYKVKNVNLNTLCDLYGAPSNPLKEQLKNIYRYNQRYWCRRPLTRDMLIYASSDVLSLVPQIYVAMAKYDLFNNFLISHSVSFLWHFHFRYSNDTISDRFQIA